MAVLLLFGRCLCRGKSQTGTETGRRGIPAYRSAVMWGKNFSRQLDRAPMAPAYDPLERHQVLDAAVALHVIEIHGSSASACTPRFSSVRASASAKASADSGRVSGGADRLQIRGPCLVLPLEQGQEDLLLRLKIVIDGGAGERGFRSDILRIVMSLKLHRLVQGRRRR